MTFSLEGWAGDNAGLVTGREANRLFLSVSHTDATVPAGLFQGQLFGGVPYYPFIYVTCLTPGARHAIAITSQIVDSNVWYIEVAEVDFLMGRDPWATGVHLFALRLGSGAESQCTFLTAVIDDNVRRLVYEPPPQEPWFDWMARLQLSGSPDAVPLASGISKAHRAGSSS